MVPILDHYGRQGPVQATLNINGQQLACSFDEGTPLLWVIRDTIGLKGTKYGCGIGQCGACMVHVDGRALPSCLMIAEDAIGRSIVTIEGLSPDRSHAVQRAWIEEGVPQCGYCQSGMIMAVVALLARNPNPTDDDIDRGILNICRCGTYPRIRSAIRRIAARST